jgi:hypothetical protein
MKIETTWNNLNRIPWNAIFECGQIYRKENPSHNDQYYQEYMLETWGIDHSDNHIRIADEPKYLMFLLRWA